MLDSLVDGEDGKVSGSREAAVVENLLEASKDGGLAIGLDEHAIHEIRPRKVEGFLRDSLGDVVQIVPGFFAEQLLNIDGHRWISAKWLGNLKYTKKTAPAKYRRKMGEIDAPGTIRGPIPGPWKGGL
jgi:hypothetical protein